MGIPGMMTRPPLSKDDILGEVLEEMARRAYESASDESKPSLKVILNRRELTSLLHMGLEWVQDACARDDRLLVRQRSTQFNAIMEPMIETLKTFIAEQVKGDMNHVSK